jgi:hypothetical protein
MNGSIFFLALILICIVISWVLVKSLHRVPGIMFQLLGIELTLFGIFTLLLWNLSSEEPFFLLVLASIFAVFGCVLTIFSTFKKN